MHLIEYKIYFLFCDQFWFAICDEKNIHEAVYSFFFGILKKLYFSFT